MQRRSAVATRRRRPRIIDCDELTAACCAHLYALAARREMAAAQPDDAAKAYYGYLFEADKNPTKVFNALLRAIAQHIVWKHSVLAPGDGMRQGCR